MDTVTVRSLALREALRDLLLDELVPLDEAARRRGVHPDTLKRNERDKLVRIGKRLYAMRLRDVLKLSE